MTCEECKAQREKEQVSHAVEVESIFAESVRETRRTNRFLWGMVAVLLALCVALSGMIAYKDATMQATIQKAIAESQEAINEAVLEALNAVADMEVTSDTVTTTLEGDSAVYNDVEGDQFNDSAQKIGGDG